MRLERKVAIITGAGQGIGEATACRFAEEGAAVACVDINGDAANRTAKAIEASGGSAIAVTVDVSTEGGNTLMVEKATRQFGGLDVLHANAGVQAMGRLDDTTVEEWDRVHNVNLRGTYLGIRAALPHLRARGGGSVIITSSLLGIVGDPDMAAYGATKGGLRAMCR